jgi:hypothetical protein
MLGNIAGIYCIRVSSWSALMKATHWCVSLLLAVGCGLMHETHAQPAAIGPRCDPTVPLVRGQDSASIALVVGVGTYAVGARIPNLVGPPNDALRVTNLLTADDGYSFPEANVCLLIDADATAQNFVRALQSFVADRADEGDVVVVYFAGHGSQTLDEPGGDEPDKYDETLIFHDGVELVDDRLFELLSSLYGITERITVILDSCNSGTAARAADSFYVSRYVGPDPSRPKLGANGSGDGGGAFVPEGAEGIVYLAAADDGTSALEVAGGGVFTGALLNVLGRIGVEPLTYAQAGRQIDVIVKGSISSQRPSYYGPVDRLVFDNSTRLRPLAHEVVEKPPLPQRGSELKLSGPFVYGMSAQAAVAIYAGSATVAAVADPLRAKATADVIRTDATDIFVRIKDLIPANGRIEIGDLAVLVTPGADVARTVVSVAANIPAEIRALVQREADTPAVSRFVELVEAGTPAEFRLEMSPLGRLMLIDSSDFVRNTFCRPSAVGCETRDDAALALSVIDAAWYHGYQKFLATRQGRGGALLRDEHTLQISLKQRDDQAAECAGVTLEQELRDGVQIVPLCITTTPDYVPFRYSVEIKVASDTPRDIKLFIGGAILWNDGRITALTQQESVPRRAGETVVLRPTTLRSRLPLNAIDRIKVFGTTDFVDWSRVGVAMRGGDAEEEPDKPWTTSMLAMRVEPNATFSRAAPGDDVPATREYTLASFDIRPYLPDDQTTDLYKVLKTAHELVVRARGRSAIGGDAAAAEGIGYKQHDWSGADDAENLRRGIDCSRAIWYAFTRAGLPYTQASTDPESFPEQYIPTASMLGLQSPMTRHFKSCDSEPLSTGDVLVYRDADRGDGHTVLVIDPQQRIAWGSHGWDGNGRTPGFVPDTGAEYQLIKYKQDWERWDRSTMRQVACWRYEGFEEEDVRVTDAAIRSCDPLLNCSY